MGVERRQGSFERAVRAHGADLYRYAYRLCRDRFAAEDLVQETFLRGWRAWQSLRDVGAARFWFRSILRHEYARRCSRLPPGVVVDLDGLAGAAALGPDAVVEAQQLIDRLPEGYRELLLMQIVDGLSSGEIARRLNATEGAVLARLGRARHALRTCLDAGDRALPPRAGAMPRAAARATGA